MEGWVEGEMDGNEGKSELFSQKNTLNENFDKTFWASLQYSYGTHDRQAST